VGLAWAEVVDDVGLGDGEIEGLLQSITHGEAEGGLVRCFLRGLLRRDAVDTEAKLKLINAFGHDQNGLALEVTRGATLASYCLRGRIW
jgi:hypothetical protein